MTSYRVEKPVVTVEGDKEIITHPAFAQISASRVTGNTYLYGSDFQYHNYVTVQIKLSELHRRNESGRDWAYGHKEILEVALSEAQWATFVSTMNVGDGVQCTLERKDGLLVPGLPPPESQAEAGRKHLGSTLSELRDQLHELAAELDGAVAKTKAADIKRRMGWLADNMVSNTEYTAKVFDRHMENTIEKAKIEINAYATNTIQRADIEALANGAKPAIEYHPKE